MTEFIRTPDNNFEALDDYPFAPNYHDWQDLRMHYLDEGPKDGPVMLLLHGMPTWSYLYRDVIPILADAGFRCIAPDHMGFGRSDKPTDLHWYTIARHTEILTSLIVTLDLQKVTLVCQDWGGPTGLAQAAMMPDRFDHLVIMNTWLHHDDYEYSEGIKQWNQGWHEGGMYCKEKPDVALILLISSGLITVEQFLAAMTQGQLPDMGDATRKMYQAYGAPFSGLPDEGFNGLRRFPLSIPVDSYHNGNAAAQSLHYRTLLEWPKSSQFIWGIQDNVFTEAWGRAWASRMNASFTPLEAGHFPQNTHGKQLAQLILQER